jgi:hypothetical protein
MIRLIRDYIANSSLAIAILLCLLSKPVLNNEVLPPANWRRISSAHSDLLFLENFSNIALQHHICLFTSAASLKLLARMGEGAAGGTMAVLFWLTRPRQFLAKFKIQQVLNIAEAARRERYQPPRQV